MGDGKGVVCEVNRKYGNQMPFLATCLCGRKKVTGDAPGKGSQRFLHGRIVRGDDHGNVSNMLRVIRLNALSAPNHASSFRVALSTTEVNRDEVRWQLFDGAENHIIPNGNQGVISVNVDA